MARRTEAFADFAAMPLPSEKEEVWRYSPVGDLDLDSYGPSPATGPGPLDPEGQAFVEGVAADLPSRSALVVTRDGRPVAAERPGLPDGVALAAPVDEAGVLAAPAAATGRRDLPVPGIVLTGGDALVRLHDAFMPDATVVDVAAGVEVDEPIVLVHWCAGGAVAGAAAAAGAGPRGEEAGPPWPASFPRTVVRVGAGARASVVELVAGATGARRALVVPVTELEVEGGGQLSYVSLQVLGTGAWHLGRLAARVGRDASLRSFTVGLGSAYDRVRADAAAAGTGAHCELRSAYLGTGGQVHDVRTLQDHLAAHTTSDLLCKGAVAGTSRSIYSGLIRVRHGAVRAEAFQTNHNLVLDRHAHADSVPNLDIQENDVRCSHASTVGPVDEDQRYYLESRGIPPERAEELIVLGFFDDIVERSPVPAATGRLRREVGARLAGALASGATGSGATGSGATASAVTASVGTGGGGASGG